jgi:FkbM family methyltransferase
MQGMIMENTLVEIDPRCVGMGGSWFARVARQVPQAWDMTLIAYFYRRAKGLKSPIMIDVGANTGSFSLIGAALPNLTGFAVEPNPEAASVLRNNLELNGLSARMQVMEVAFGDRAGTARLKVPAQTGLATLGTPRDFREWREVKVPVMTLDDFAAQHLRNGVDLLKIDTEGAELQVLIGGRKMLEALLPEILLEVNELRTMQFGYRAEEILRFAASLGYITQRVGPEDVYCRHPRAFRF